MMALFHLLSAILLAIAPSAAYTLKTRITSLNRFRLRCKLDIDTTSDLAAQLEIPSSGIIPYIGKSVFDHNLTATTYPSFRNATGRELFITKFNLWKQLPWKKIKGKVTLKLKVGGSLDLDPSRGGFIGGGSRDPELVSSLPELFTLFQFAAYDPRITSILLEIDRLNVGYAALEEVKRMMSLFRQSGKQIVGYCSSGAEKELFLALQCDEFYIPPGGDLDLRGFSAAATFLRGIFDKVGIEPQVQRIGKYKSFGDTFNRTTISEAQREVLSSLLVESSEFWAHTVARALNQSVEAVRSIWAEVGVTTVEDWKQKGFITGVKYLDQVEALMALRQQSSSPSIPLSVRLSSLVNAEALEKYNEAVQNETQSILADVNDFELESDFLKYPRRSNSSHSEKVTNKSAAASIKSAVKRSSLLRYLPASIYLRKMRKGNEILRGLPVKEVNSTYFISVLLTYWTVSCFVLLGERRTSDCSD